MHILYIKALNEQIKEKYKNHSTYHSGDSGLDLFVPETITIPAGTTQFIDHQIQCEMVEQMPNPLINGTMSSLKIQYDLFNETYLLLPRSSISKTPLIMANSIGLIDCFSEDMLIKTVDGDKLVKNLNITDAVVSYCSDGLETDIIEGIINKGQLELFQFETDNGILEVTENTPICTDNGWKLAKDVTIGDNICFLNELDVFSIDEVKDN